jgi:DNA invertase Pin-like site-specific DNA recombinase
MKNSKILRHPLIAAEQLKRTVIVYDRQSTDENAGSSRTLHQNQIELARAYGWPEHLTEIIHEDMGKGGASVDDRTGWQRRLAGPGNNAVGMVFTTSVSRLTRQVSAYDQLLSLVADHGTLLCIGNQIIDPSDQPGGTINEK